MKKGTEEKIFVGKSLIHGKGVFANQKITAGEHIGSYEGPEVAEDNTHVLWVTDENGKTIGIDGKTDLRFLNHSRQPNAEFDGAELYAKTTIEPGDELTFHYGEEWKDID